MKTKAVRNKSTGDTFLRLKTQKGVTLAFDQAYTLGLHPKQYILPFKYAEKVNCVVFDFDAQGLVNLESALATTISFEQFFKLLNIINNVMDLIIDGQFELENVVFDPKHVFVDAEFSPKLMYLCVKNRKKDEFGVETFVTYLVENVKFARTLDSSVLKEVKDYLALQRAFSFYKFARFVDELSRKHKVLDYSYLAEENTNVNLGSLINKTPGVYSFVNLETCEVASGE